MGTAPVGTFRKVRIKLDFRTEHRGRETFTAETRERYAVQNSVPPTDRKLTPLAMGVTMGRT
jgi:hypothetical protein